MNDQKKKPMDDATAQALVKQMANTEVEKDQVVSMVGNLIGMLGNMGGRTSSVLPRTTPAPSKVQKPEVSAKIKHLSEVLHNAATEQNLDILRNDDQFMYWIKKEGCKQKTFDDELQFVRQAIGLTADMNGFDLAMLAADKAISMARIHARNDVELLSELYWVKAEIFASTDKMPDALKTLKQCVAIADPDADENSEAYKELAKQLEESRARAKNARL